MNSVKAALSIIIILFATVSANAETKDEMQAWQSIFSSMDESRQAAIWENTDAYKNASPEKGYSSIRYEFIHEHLSLENLSTLVKHGLDLNKLKSTNDSDQYLLERIAIFREDSVHSIKWFINNGYTATPIELGYALSGSLGKHDLPNTVEIFKTFMDLGAELSNVADNPKYHESNSHQLMMSMQYHFDDIDLLKTMVNAGLNINASSSSGVSWSGNGSTLLHFYAGQCGFIEENKDILKAYVELGLDLNHKSDEGKTPVSRAASLPCESNVLALKALGAEVGPDIDKALAHYTSQASDNSLNFIFHILFLLVLESLIPIAIFITVSFGVVYFFRGRQKTGHK